MTPKKKNLSKILINLIKIRKITLALKTNLHRSLKLSWVASTQRKLDLLIAKVRLSPGKRHSAKRVL